MGRVLQKKKNRSSTPKQRPKRTGQLKSGKKKINVLGNAIIAQNWSEIPNLPIDQKISN